MFNKTTLAFMVKEESGLWGIKNNEILQTERVGKNVTCVSVASVLIPHGVEGGLPCCWGPAGSCEGQSFGGQARRDTAPQ